MTLKTDLDTDLVNGRVQRMSFFKELGHLGHLQAILFVILILDFCVGLIPCLRRMNASALFKWLNLSFREKNSD